MTNLSCDCQIATKGFFCLSLRISGIIIGLLELPFCGFFLFVKCIVGGFYGIFQQTFLYYFLMFGLFVEATVAVSAIFLIIGAWRVSLRRMRKPSIQAKFFLFCLFLPAGN